MAKWAERERLILNAAASLATPTGGPTSEEVCAASGLSPSEAALVLPVYGRRTTSRVSISRRWDRPSRGALVRWHCGEHVLVRFSSCLRSAIPSREEGGDMGNEAGLP